jgi:hypothetical protein
MLLRLLDARAEALAYLRSKGNGKGKARAKEERKGRKGVLKGCGGGSFCDRV